MQVKITNNFHNTEIWIRISEQQYKEYYPNVSISETTYRKIKNKLCGANDCLCGIDRGSTNKIYKGENNYPPIISIKIGIDNIKFNKQKY